MRGLFLSLLSGFLAACASVCGKISMTTDEPLAVCEAALEYFYPEDILQYVSSFSDNYDHRLTGVKMTNSERMQLCLDMKVLVIVRVVFFALMVACNAVMWVSFTKALVLCSTTVSTTLINTASNFICSAIFGVILFGERPGWLWWFGTVLIGAGLFIMHRQTTVEPRITHRRGVHPHRLKTS